MANELRYLSGYNGFLPKESGIVIAYVRRPEEFAINDYIQYVEGPTVGVYNRLGRDQNVRSTSTKNYGWEDGDPRPKHDSEKHPFTLIEYRTKRRDYGWTLGYKAIANASWRPKVAHMDDAISQCMTQRTQRVITLLETAATWEGNTASANTLNGGKGKWDTASSEGTSGNYNAIYKSLWGAFLKMHLATNAKVKVKNVRVLVSPIAALAIAQSDELQNYQRETPQAEKIALDGLGGEASDSWTLPKKYKGFQFVVEDSPYVGEYPTANVSMTAEATTNRLYVKSDTSAILVHRQGGLDAEYGSKNFSTVMMAHYGGLMEVEAFDNPRDRLVEGHVSEDVSEFVPAPQSGYLITSIL